MEETKQERRNFTETRHKIDKSKLISGAFSDGTNGLGNGIIQHDESFYDNETGEFVLRTWETFDAA